MADEHKLKTEELDALKENVANLHMKLDHVNRILSESFITLKIIEQHDTKIDQCINLLNKLTHKVVQLEQSVANSKTDGNRYGRPQPPFDLQPIKLEIPKKNTANGMKKQAVPCKPKLSLQDILIGELKQKLKGRPKIE